ncbi:MAG TPA: carboxymuconolactone decarboxylase family protein [Polyangiaceae bacterium]|nr:carboxymuconolactone decarboxylase family protein [Polyangiaceae bacterium]
MTRLASRPIETATGATAETFARIRRAMGAVPNAYVDIGTNSLPALQSLLALDASLKQGRLAAQDIEVIKLAVSEANGCDYCVAAHAFLGGRLGLDPAAVDAARFGTEGGTARHRALAAFARDVATSRGPVAAERIDAVRAAGVSDAEIVDTLWVITAITFTNLFNRVNDTALDFPAVAAAPRGAAA